MHSKKPKGTAWWLTLLALPFILVLSDVSAETSTANYAFRFPAGGKIILDPAIDMGRVWILAEGRQVYTMQETGTVTGKGQTSIRSPLFIVPDGFGRLLVSDGTSAAELINQQGKIVWSVKLNSKLAVPPFFDRLGALYLCTGNNLVVYTPAGKVREFITLPAGSVLYAAPVRAENHDQILVVLSANQGSSVMLVSPERRVKRTWKLPAVPSKITGDNTGFVAATGKTLWSAAWQDEEPSVRCEFSATITDFALADTFPIALLDNRTLAMVSGGKLAWQVQTKVSGPSRIRVSEERVFVYSNSVIQSFSRDGTLFRELSVSNSTTLLVPGLSGNVFSGGADWIVYVYRFETQETAIAPTVAGTSEQELTQALQEELRWLPAGYTDSSFIPVLEAAQKALTQLEPVSRMDELMLLACAAAPDTNGIPDPEKNLSIPLRANACRVLGALGNPEMLPFLVAVAVTETDETLVSAALEAIADISIDPYDAVLKRLARDFKITQSTQIAYALIRCITTLVRSQGTAKNLEALTLLTRLQDQRFPDAVRKKAQEALTALLR